MNDHKPPKKDGTNRKHSCTQRLKIQKSNKKPNKISNLRESLGKIYQKETKYSVRQAIYCFNGINFHLAVASKPHDKRQSNGIAKFSLPKIGAFDEIAISFLTS